MSNIKYCEKCGNELDENPYKGCCDRECFKELCSDERREQRVLVEILKHK